MRKTERIGNTRSSHTLSRRALLFAYTQFKVELAPPFGQETMDGCGDGNAGIYSCPVKEGVFRVGDASCLCFRGIRELFRGMQVASFFQAYFSPIGRLEISPEIVVTRVKSQSLFMALGQNRDKPSINNKIQR